MAKSSMFSVRMTTGDEEKLTRIMKRLGHTGPTEFLRFALDFISEKLDDPDASKKYDYIESVVESIREKLYRIEGKLTTNENKLEENESTLIEVHKNLHENLTVIHKDMINNLTWMSKGINSVFASTNENLRDVRDDVKENRIQMKQAEEALRIHSIEAYRRLYGTLLLLAEKMEIDIINSTKERFVSKRAKEAHLKYLQAVDQCTKMEEYRKNILEGDYTNFV